MLTYFFTSYKVGKLVTLFLKHMLVIKIVFPPFLLLLNLAGGCVLKKSKITFYPYYSLN